MRIYADCRTTGRRQAEQRINGRTLSDAELTSEAVANFMMSDYGPFGKNAEQVFNSIVSRMDAPAKRGFIETVKNFLHRMIERLKGNRIEAEFIKMRDMWDGMVARTQETANTAEKNTVREDGGKYAFTDSVSGRANDKLLQYDEELRGYIEARGDRIIETYDELTEFVDKVYSDRGYKATAYFGIIPFEITEQIENDIPNLPTELNGELFKKNKMYSVAATADSIRHLNDGKNLTREQIIGLLNNLADTIVDYDTAFFDWYHPDSTRQKGILFKKAFSNGINVSFDVVSNKKSTLNLQTMYLENIDIKNEPRQTMPIHNNGQATRKNQNAFPHTSETLAGRGSDSIVSQTETNVNTNSENNFAGVGKNALATDLDNIVDSDNGAEQKRSKAEITANREIEELVGRYDGGEIGREELSDGIREALSVILFKVLSALLFKCFPYRIPGTVFIKKSLYIAVQCVHLVNRVHSVIGNADFSERGCTHKFKEAETGLSVTCALKILIVFRQNLMPCIFYGSVSLNVRVYQLI